MPDRPAMERDHAPTGRVDAIERAICQETCAYRGEPACWKVCPEAWPNPECDEPGCRALAVAAEIAIRQREANATPPRETGR